MFAFSFRRHAARSTALLLAISAALATLSGCAAATDDVDAESSDESALTKAINVGNFQSDLTASARLRPGYLYRIEIGKKYLGHQYATVYLVSDLCGKQRADKTCDKSFIEKNAKSLDRYWNDITVNTTSKSFTFSYEKPDPQEGFVTQELSWTYKNTSASKISLTPKGSTTAFTMSKMAALPKIDAGIKKTFEKWMNDTLQGDTSDIDSAPSVRTEDLPLEAQRIAHYFDVEFSGDYSTDSHKITVGGKQYYALYQGTDGGANYHFFTIAGAYLGSYGGSESGEWDFSWNE